MTAQGGAYQSDDGAQAGGGSPHLPAFRDPDLALFDQYQPDPDWPRPDRFAGWDIANWCRLGVYEGDEGLHLTVSTRDADYTRSVTAEQVESFANNLSALLRALRKYPKPEPEETP